LTSALGELETPHAGWLAGAVAAGLMAMGAYARMQHTLLRSAGLRVPLHRTVALAYAAHSLNETLPGGPAFSTGFTYRQMRRFGATPAVASWCIALSGILSTTALAVLAAGGALASDGTPQWYGIIGLTVGIALLVAGVRRISGHPGAVESSARAVMARLRRRIPERGLDRVLGFVEQLGAARLTAGRGLAAALFAVLNWVLDAVCLWLCLRAVSDDPIAAVPLLLAFCAGMAAGTVTLVPGGLGIIDSALLLGLVTGGVPASAAIAGVVLYRIISFGFIIGVGWIAWIVLRRRAGGQAAGRHTSNRQPPTTLRTPTRPPCASTRPRTMARPSPPPASDGVRARSPRTATSKTRPRSSSGMPPQVSETASHTSSRSCPAAMCTVPSARTELISRLPTTRVSAASPARTTGHPVSALPQ